MILVDSNVIFDSPRQRSTSGCAWSVLSCNDWFKLNRMSVNAIVYAEISPRYRSQAKVDELLKELKTGLRGDSATCGLSRGKAHFLYRARWGEDKARPCPIFLSAPTQLF